MLKNHNRRSAILLAGLLSIASLSGCGRMVFQPTEQPGAMALSPVEQQTLAMQTQQFQQRATDLDRDNVELGSLLAQSRQQTQLLEDQVRATQAQLRDTATRLASVQQENDHMRSRTTAMAASIQRQSQAEIRANNSLVRDLTSTNLPGVEVRQDGDVIRIEVPSDQLFNRGTAQAKYGSDGVLRSVGADLLRNYPNQIIGIEGHTDTSPSMSTQYPTAQHLSIAQAMAVYDTLTRAAGAPPSQLFVVGHGSNHPVVSNATESGQARNRRIEIVIYPETVRQ